MNAEVVQEFVFEAAHFLPEVAVGHACGRVHGHSYRVAIHVAGRVDPRTGFVIDFHDVEASCGPAIARLDHRLLNEVEGLPNPTAEHIAAWLWDRITPALPGLVLVEIWETPASRVLYRGPESVTR